MGYPISNKQILNKDVKLPRTVTIEQQTPPRSDVRFVYSSYTWVCANAVPTELGSFGSPPERGA